MKRMKRNNKKIKNTCEIAYYITVGQYNRPWCEYCDLLELEIPDSYKKPYCDCFFPFLTTMFITVVPTSQ